MQAPVLLRLAFHDAATHEVSAGDGGANASVQYEFSRPENTGLKRGWCDLSFFLPLTLMMMRSTARVIAITACFSI